MSTQRERFEAAWKAGGDYAIWTLDRNERTGEYLSIKAQAAFEGFQLGEASGLERAAAECKRLSTAIDNVGTTYNRDTTSTHCVLAWALMAQGEI